MGGYGGSSHRTKGKCYYDTGGNKVTDKNAITVAEAYIREGKYVAFLQEKKGQERADLSVEGVHTEVKGLTTIKPDKIKERIEKANSQVKADDYRYPEETHRKGKVVLLSKHSGEVSSDTIIEKMKEGMRRAELNGHIEAKVELWIGNRRIALS